MTSYFLDNTGTVEAAEVGGSSNFIVIDDGIILIPPADIRPVTVLEMEIFNPRKLAVRYELLGVPDGKNISIRQAEAAAVEVLIEGAVLDDEYRLTIGMQSADGLRDFGGCDMQVRCVIFDTGLSDFRVNDVHPLFSSGDPSFTVALPYQTTGVTLEGAALDPAAALTLFQGRNAAGPPIASGLGRALNSTPAPVSEGDNFFYLEVRRGWTVQGYTVKVTRLPNDSKDITEFYVTLGGKKYGAGDGTESNSGSISGNTIAVTVPYGTDLTALSAVANHTGNSITPAPAGPQDYSGGPVSYTVTAADTTEKIYTVTVGKGPGIDITAAVSGLTALSFTGGPGSTPVTAGTSFTIALSGGTATAWAIYISGPVSADHSTATFAAPAVSGFYNVNVIATAGGVDYSGSFGLIVE
jgi:hypothetical protein